MAFKDLSHDLRHCQVLKNSLVMAELQVVKRWHQGQLIAGQTFTGLAHEDLFDMAMNAFTPQTKLEKRRLTEQALQIEISGLTDKFNLDRIQAADGFGALKGQHLEVVANRGDQ